MAETANHVEADVYPHKKSDIDWKEAVVRLYKKRAKKIEEMLESENKIVERF